MLTFRLPELCSPLHMRAGQTVNWIRAAILTTIAISAHATLAAPVESGPALPSDFCRQGRFPDSAIGTQALYIFATHDAPASDLAMFLSKVRKAGLELQLLTVNINGYDSLIVVGAKGIRETAAIRREYLTACTMRVGQKIFLSRVMRNTGEEDMNKGGVALAAALSVAMPGSPASASPPPPVVVRPANAPAIPATAVFDVVVRAGSEKLWSGSLRVSRNGGGSSYEESLQQPYEPCEGEGNPDRELRLGSGSRQVNVRLNHRGGGGADSNQFSVSASWQRPYSACEGGGTTTLRFDRQVSIGPGETRELVGDGGLAVKLHRKP